MSDGLISRKANETREMNDFEEIIGFEISQLLYWVLM